MYTLNIIPILQHKKKNYLTGTNDIVKATEDGQLKEVIYHIETGSSPNQKDAKHNQNIIHIAAEGGHSEIVKILIEKGANVNAKDNFERTAFHLASERGHLEIVQCLLVKGADVNAKVYWKRTALHLASETGHLKTVQCLIDNGADVSAKDKLEISALHLASEKGHLEIVQYLNAKGADINAKDEDKQTALHLASREGHLKNVQCLIEKGANVNAKDEDNQTALHFASERGHLEIVQCLIANNADVNAKSKFDSSSISPLPLLLNFYFAAIMPSRAFDSFPAKTTALHMASKNGHLQIVKYLIEMGADSNAKDARGRTALHLASEQNTQEAVRGKKFADDEAKNLYLASRKEVEKFLTSISK